MTGEQRRKPSTVIKMLGFGVISAYVLWTLLSDLLGINQGPFSPVLQLVVAVFPKLSGPSIAVLIIAACTAWYVLDEDI